VLFYSECKVVSMSGQTKTSHHALLIYNKRSGNYNPELLETFAQAVYRAGWTLERCEITELPSDWSRFARVAVAGGDGTINSVTEQLRYLKIPLLVIPAGTGNLIAQNLNMPKTPLELAELLVNGTTTRYDLAELEIAGKTLGFTMLAGAGLDAQMIRDSEKLKDSLGLAAYWVGVFKQLTPQESEFLLDLDSVPTIRTQGIGILIANFGMVNFQLPIVTGIDASDGLLDVVILKGKSALSLLPHVMDSIRGKLGWNPLFEDRLEIYTCRRLKLEVKPGLPAQYDGELLEGIHQSLSARVLPGAIHFLVP
jgi:diacylglycerol kinase (ATP)